MGAGPNFFDNGSGTLYLHFTRNAFPGDQDGFHIYVSTCSKDIDTCNTQGLWDQGRRVATLNAPSDAVVPFHRDTRTAIRRHGLEMILSSSRQGSLASENLWVSTRPVVTLDQQNWALPEPLNCDDNTGFTSSNTRMFVPCSPWNPERPLVNSTAFDGGPALSSDGTELYLFRVNPVSANNAIAFGQKTRPRSLPTKNSAPFEDKTGLGGLLARYLCCEPIVRCPADFYAALP